MWLYIGFCIALFYVVKSQSNTPNNEPEEIFVDVMKNISRVNNVLQELISNYETLQKIYKSQENIDSSKFSDSDIDEVFQSIKKEPRSQTSKATKKEKFAATEMYWSDHEEDTKDKKFNQSKEDLKKKGNVIDKDKNVVRQKPRTITTTLKPEESSSSESSESDENAENVLKEKIKMLPNSKEKNNKHISKSNKAETEFDDGFAISALDMLLQPFIETKAAKTRSRKINKPKEKNAKAGYSIPYLTLSDEVKAVDISQKTRTVKRTYLPKADVSNNMRTHKKKMFSEALTTKKSFYDLVKDKPIQLETHTDIFMENVKKPVTNREIKYRDETVTHKTKRRDIDKLAKLDSKYHHKKEDINEVTINGTHLKLLRTDNVKIAKGNVTHHKTKKYHSKFDDNTEMINNDHEKASIDHETYNNDNHETIDEEARGTDNDNTKTRDDDKETDIGYKKGLNHHEKANKRQKKADIEPETNNKNHEMVNNNEEQRDTVAKNKKNKKSYKETQVKSSDESVFMDKNETNVLREAYGEACMKVVVRKCFKACMSTSKVVCSQTKCKSSLKSKFKEKAKTGCLERFTAVEKRTEDLKSTLKKDEDLFSRKALQENVNNLNAGGFHVCLPSLIVQTEQTPKPSTNETNSPRRVMKQKSTDEKFTFNILRDRFEKACKKLSFKKCHDACKCAWDSACAEYECSKRLKTLYKKSCKTNCKSAYGLKAKRDSDSDGSSSSSSDDSSDSS